MVYGLMTNRDYWDENNSSMQCVKINIIPHHEAVNYKNPSSLISDAYSKLHENSLILLLNG